MERPHVVIIGGGFGGLAAAQALRRAPVRVTLIDKRNHHLFQPLLYQVATASLAPSDIAEPLRAILGGQANVEIVLAEVTDLDVVGRRVITESREIPYDHLIVAAGAESSYFGHDEWVAHAPGLKTIGDALDVRHRVLRSFEEAEWCDDEERLQQLLTFVVIGGGPTGVEMAGAIREIGEQILGREFRHVDPKRLRVVLVEAAPKVLLTFPEDLQASALSQLQRLGVEVLTGAPVERVDACTVVAGGQTLRANTIVWAAGVRASPLAKALGVPLDRGGRAIVQPDLSIPGHPEVRVIGDLAHVEQDGAMVPGVAPAAIAMGKHAARTILEDIIGQPRRPFHHVDKGALATIGRKMAVADLRIVHLRGFLAWVVWVFVHLMTLVGHRNRAVVFVKWAWAWFTLDSSSRLLWKDEVARDHRFDLRTLAGQRLADREHDPATPSPPS